MTQMEKLPKTQAAALFIVLPMMVLAENGEITEYAARKAGANLAALYALKSKGILATRKGEFLMPEGIYKGKMMPVTFYSAA